MSPPHRGIMSVDESVYRSQESCRNSPALDGGQAKLLNADLLASAAHDGPFDHGGELADVARPAVTPQLVLGIPRQPPDFTLTFRQPRREDTRERQNVFGALAQRQQDERGWREAIKQIRAEGAAADQIGEIGVGRGNDSNVKWSRVATTEASHQTAVDCREHLALQIERQRIDIVQEQRAAVGGLEQPWSRPRGVWGHAALVAEQLALQPERRP